MGKITINGNKGNKIIPKNRFCLKFKSLNVLFLFIN